jgi:hypothetical protein
MIFGVKIFTVDDLLQVFGRGRTGFFILATDVVPPNLLLFPFAGGSFQVSAILEPF